MEKALKHHKNTHEMLKHPSESHDEIYFTARSSLKQAEQVALQVLTDSYLEAVE